MQDDAPNIEMSNNPYDLHLEHCEQCRDAPLDQCSEGDRALREAVESGEARSYDRTLHEIRSADRG